MNTALTAEKEDTFLRTARQNPKALLLEMWKNRSCNHRLPSFATNLNRETPTEANKKIKQKLPADPKNGNQ